MSEGTRSGALSRVVLAISAFRSEESVVALLKAAFARNAPEFGSVIVVDSLGSNTLARTIAEHGWPVEYRNASTNLGSAGNLHLRLELAATTGLDWCLALNHDGILDLAKAQLLVECGQSIDRVGAVYPQMRYPRAAGRLDRPRRALGTIGQLDEVAERAGPVDVAWSSSNGALYRLAAVSAGINAWPELWMGYEDLAIGWELQRKGWRQILCPDVIVDDNYEFRPVVILGRTFYLVDKPVWYCYYQLRNMALIARYTRGRALSWRAVISRSVIDLILLSLRKQRLSRFKLLTLGLWDGLRGKAGKGPVP